VFITSSITESKETKGEKNYSFFCPVINFSCQRISSSHAFLVSLFTRTFSVHVFVYIVTVFGGVQASIRVRQNFLVLPSTPGETDESERGIFYRNTSALYLLEYFTCTPTRNTDSRWFPLNFYLPSNHLAFLTHIFNRRLFVFVSQLPENRETEKVKRL
jgi:hypothetical protein